MSAPFAEIGVLLRRRASVGVLGRIAIAALLATPILSLTAPSALAQGTGNNYRQMGCYYNPSDHKLWLAAVSLTPQGVDPNFYDDPKQGFTVVMKDARGTRFDVDGKDVIVHVLNTFNFKGAEKYKFLKYSLVIDYSSSIPVNTRTDILNFLDKFVARLPLAVEGQLIRFSDNVERFPFTTDKKELQLELRQPITYGSTALHDALMEGASALVQQGSNTPVRVLVLFTDGFENSSTTYKDRANFISTFTNLVKAERIVVLAVGVSHEQDEQLLRAITDNSSGVLGYYLRVEDFDMFEPAFNQIETLLRNTVIFRIPKLGQDKGKVEIAIATKSAAGNLSTLQVFNCEF